ncbi:NIPA-like protein 2 isoform X3 [Hemiscyllium ocellatum]|uniref:NIPA-like protein 2 isoform X3 n=1 Tax=Hemiscyllium ocellatum TaxID=170820 RepID=UPI0029673A9D|nr:NIPA-like protein 2 isoform X3 [Hemiscyllium ocellatum]
MASAVSVATPLELVPNVSERQNSTLSPTWSNLHPYQTNILGTVLAITGNVLISISLNVQKYSHIRLLCQESRTPYYKSKLWWCGILLMGMGGSLAVLGTYLLVTFAINVQQEITGPKINLYIISWPFLVYLTLEFILFVILLYLFKRRGMNHIVILLLMSSILASLTVISVKAVSGMVTSSIQGQLQFQYPIFYVMLVVMIASCIFQVQFLNQAMRLYNATEVVPINFVFFTTSAIIAGVIFYQEFHGAALLNIFMFLFGCLLSFLGVFLIAKNRVKQTPEVPYIDMGPVPKQRSTEKIQPGLNNINSYGSVHDEEQTNDSLSEDVK